MTDRKTLQLRDPSEDSATPTLKKKGRGWEISEKRLDALHERAREMRRFPSEAHKALAERFAKANLGRYTFKRFAVVGSAIVDFQCHNLGLAVVIDEGDQPDAIMTRSDRALEAVGIRVFRVTAAEVLENMDDVLARLTLAMRECIAAKGAARRQHHTSNPRQTAPRSYGPRPKGQRQHRERS